MTRVYFKNTRRFVRRFKKDTQGSMTVFGLFFFLFSGILGAIALDVASLYSDRTHLQVAADQAAHAALFNRRIVGLSENESRQKAINIVNATLPTTKYGSTIELTDIEFGTYVETLDEDTGTISGLFTVSPSNVDAARAVTSFSADGVNANAAQTFLFRLVGIDAFDIVTDAIVAAAGKDCLTDGFISNTRVEFQNQNLFGDGICIHSNGNIKMGPNNNFHPGAVVSLPRGESNLELPIDADGNMIDPSEVGDEGFTLDEVLERIATYDLNVLNRVQTMIEFYTGEDFTYTSTGDDAFWPSYIAVEGDTPVLGWQEMSVTDFDPETVDPSKAYSVNCNRGNQTLDIGGGNNDPAVSLDGILLVTNCPIKFGSNVSITRSRIVTTYEPKNDADTGISAPSGLAMGTRTGNCEDEGSGVQLISVGGIKLAGRATMYDTQVFSYADVEIRSTTESGGNSDAGSATPDFIGSAIVAEGAIDMNSNMNVQAGCSSGSGGGDNISATGIRLVN